MCYDVVSKTAQPYVSDLLHLYTPSRSLRSTADTRNFRVSKRKKSLTLTFFPLLFFIFFPLSLLPFNYLSCVCVCACVRACVCDVHAWRPAKDEQYEIITDRRPKDEKYSCKHIWSKTKRWTTCSHWSQTKRWITGLYNHNSSTEDQSTKISGQHTHSLTGPLTHSLARSIKTTDLQTVFPVPVCRIRAGKRIMSRSESG